jgi:hypothetical protein
MYRQTPDFLKGEKLQKSDLENEIQKLMKGEPEHELLV